MVFVLGFDNGYSPFADATIASVCVNNAGEHLFYVITDYLSDDNRKKLERDVKCYGSSIEYIFVNENDIKDFPLGPHMANNYVSIATYFRLFMIDKLPEKVQKVIYLDCDVIVNGSLSLIWNWKFKDGHCILAANDEPKNAGLSTRRLGYDYTYSYFNAGVLMVDLVKLRKVLDKNIINSYIRQHINIIKFHDQDILNALLFDKRDVMPVEYNMLEVYYMKGQYLDINGNELLSKLRNPIIIHYSGPIKPWHTECKHPLKDVFFQYICKTNFSAFMPSRKYNNLKLKSMYVAKQVVKFFLELFHVRFYNYIDFL